MRASRLESLCTLKAYRGFESHPVRCPATSYLVLRGFAFQARVTTGADSWCRLRQILIQTERFALRLGVRPSASPESLESLDQENDQLKTDVYQLYLGLLIAVPFFSSNRVTSLTGASADGVPRVCSLAVYPRTFYTLGARTPTITIQRAKLSRRRSRTR